MRLTRKTAGFGFVAIVCGLVAALSAAADSLPKQDWEVGPINAASANGLKFCSMKNVFEGGHMLVVARDAEGANSLAISFPQKLLQSGGQYTVDLSADNVKRKMIALAGTPQVMLIQMGLDREFYSGLQKKSSLGVSFASQKLSFSLSGTQDALNALTKCASDISVGREFKPVTVAVKTPLDAGEPVIPPDAMPGKNIGVEAAETTLKDEIERLRLENRKLLAENHQNAQQVVQADIDLQAEREKQQRLAAEQGMAAARAAVHVTFPDEAKPDVEDTPVAPKIVAAPDTFLSDIMTRSQLPATKRGNTYSWTAKDLFGAAEQRAIPAGGTLQDAVSAYVEQAKARCKGDFAHNESEPVKNVRGAETVEGEFACIDGENDAAAALLFVAQQGKVAIIAHEGSTDQMEDALSDRAAVISNLSR
ncbi:MAG: hypothetical protein JNM12_01120 [Alphaproteobacteria bacterium]|nr:hypothetical protein [Alphaproteobacteria bacterium]